MHNKINKQVDLLLLPMGGPCAQLLHRPDLALLRSRNDWAASGPFAPPGPRARFPCAPLLSWRPTIQPSLVALFVGSKKPWTSPYPTQMNP